jgi:hypothetical protein
MGSNAARHDDANDFLGERSACGGDLACLRPLYQARIHALKEDIDRAMNNVLREENASPSGPALPPAIQTIIVGYADQCRQLGGTLSAEDNSPLIMTGDFDRDGKPDYVLNPQNLRCSAAATAFCGNGGCQIIIALSGKGYQEPITVLGGQPTLIQRSDGTDVDVWVDSSNCKLKNKEKACWVSYSWKDGKVNESYRARPLPD